MGDDDRAEPAPLYRYAFTVALDPRWNYSQHTVEVFSMMNTTVEMVMTQKRFELLRVGVEGMDKFVLRDVTRVPYREPESIK